MQGKRSDRLGQMNVDSQKKEEEAYRLSECKCAGEQGVDELIDTRRCAEVRGDQARGRSKGGGGEREDRRTENTADWKNEGEMDW